MKILHAVDLHIDSPLRGLSAYEDAPEENLRLATRTALENLVRLAIETPVDAVLLAGDVYDGDWPDYQTGLYFSRRERDSGGPEPKAIEPRDSETGDASWHSSGSTTGSRGSGIGLRATGHRAMLLADRAEVSALRGSPAAASGIEIAPVVPGRIGPDPAGAFDQPSSWSSASPS
ncbi:exonuclease SbcCD subunit D [Actinomadura adrarensis]|uniref:Exonuclease SbcCD subunit D n=1 Tax=Actinomadura adrarensis TaxID=1819600 RepID=A0ABW3CRQ5_9ACTN